MQPPHRAPSRIGDYEPLVELATGGMATVFAARKVGAGGFERLVVLKRVHRHLLSSPEFRNMFRDEARVASMIHHPNVVPVIDVVEWESELLLVMEYVDSSSLATLVKASRSRRGSLAPEVSARILADTLNGLYAAHESVDMAGRRLDVVHRDVSPQNILVAADGSSRLIDFGVAKARHRLTETRSGSLKGKYAYMSPEQTRGQPVDARSDLFSTGAVLFEVLTGRSLFRGETDFETMQRILSAPVPRPSVISPKVPAALDAVVLRSLERDPDRRFQSAAEMLEHLERAIRPASSRDVAACLDQFCGDRLQQRRDLLRSILDRPAGAVVGLESGEPRPEQLASTVSSVPSVHSTSQLASAHDADPLLRPARRRVGLVVSVALALVAGLLVASWMVLRPSADVAVSTTSGSAAPASAPAAAAAPAAKDAAAEARREDSGAEASAPAAASSSSEPAAAPPPTHRAPPAPTRELHANPYGAP